jgi:hypothetical protein
MRGTCAHPIKKGVPQKIHLGCIYIARDKAACWVHEVYHGGQRHGVELDLHNDSRDFLVVDRVACGELRCGDNSGNIRSFIGHRFLQRHRTGDGQGAEWGVVFSECAFWFFRKVFLVFWTIKFRALFSLRALFQKSTAESTNSTANMEFGIVNM